MLKKNKKHGRQTAHHIVNDNKNNIHCIVVQIFRFRKHFLQKVLHFGNQFYTWVNSLEAKQESTELEWSNSSL